MQTFSVFQLLENFRSFSENFLWMANLWPVGLSSLTPNFWVCQKIPATLHLPPREDVWFCWRNLYSFGRIVLKNKRLSDFSSFSVFKLEVEGFLVIRMKILDASRDSKYFFRCRRWFLTYDFRKLHTLNNRPRLRVLECCVYLLLLRYGHSHTQCYRNNLRYSHILQRIINDNVYADEFRVVHECIPQKQKRERRETTMSNLKPMDFGVWV